MSTEPTLPQGVLDKVAALLAKAESTTFDAEAEGWHAGTRFADQADLSTDPALTRRTA